MPLSLNEIRDRARAFAKEWAGETSERAEAQSFWNGFFDVFGVNRRRVAVFEQKAERFSGSKHGRIDVFWPGVMLAEHKSAGVDLDAAYRQATDYFAGIGDAELPRYVLVSDFARFRLHDLDGDAAPVEFPLAELHKQIGRFGFISGYQTRSYKEEDPVNVQAAERMGRLHDALKAAGYDGHALELLLVRLLFCLFADDTGIFPRHAFHDLVAQRTSVDGADLGMWIARVFQLLNTPEARRQSTEDAQLAELPYVNGRLFEETLPLAAFNAQMRGLLLEASALDWSRISPAIFGSMFQSVMDAKARRNLGAHYTSEKNILKLIGPLFLDGLRAEFGKLRGRQALHDFQERLAALTFLDPACGCGNFLVIAYRELRLLELDVILAMHKAELDSGQRLDPRLLVKCNVDKFYGIEIEEFPAQIAQVAMWLMDHQMNLRVQEAFGNPFVRLPLTASATIVHGNALRLDWNNVVPAEALSYILGNPPFIGHSLRTAEQASDMDAIWGEDGRFGRLDFVSAWYRKAADMMNANPSIQAAFVSTNSICQGEQVGTLWGDLLSRGVKISFAHRTFQWNNEARGIAAVHCVIVGFGKAEAQVKRIFDYESPKAEPYETQAVHINPYLVDAPDVILPSRSDTPIGLPKLTKGSQPTDGGHLILEDHEADHLRHAEPASTKWLRKYVGAEELVNGGHRWCLWLKGISPQELRSMPLVQQRIASVAEVRAKSPTKSVRDYALLPTLFTQDRQPSSPYLAIPAHTSENRKYIPFGFLEEDVIASNAMRIAEGATVYHFGVLESAMHMAWIRYTCGRLKSDYRYEPAVYNNFPWPEIADHKHRTAIEAAAQGVLDARAQFPDATLADLYDPLTMPPALVKAHTALDKAVDAAYLAAEKAAGRKPPKLGSDAERVAFLFERYQALTSLLPADKPKKTARKRRGE